jgi:hypothetical protein
MIIRWLAFFLGLCRKDLPAAIEASSCRLSLQSILSKSFGCPSHLQRGSHQQEPCTNWQDMMLLLEQHTVAPKSRALDDADCTTCPRAFLKLAKFMPQDLCCFLFPDNWSWRPRPWCVIHCLSRRYPKHAKPLQASPNRLNSRCTRISSTCSSLLAPTADQLTWGPEQATAATGTDFAHSAKLSNRLPFTIEFLLYLHRIARHSLLRPSLVSGMCFRHDCSEERGLLCHFSRASCNSNFSINQGKVMTR